MATEAWWTLELAFDFLCVVGAGMFAIWLFAAIVSASFMRPRRKNHRVGGDVK